MMLHSAEIRWFFPQALPAAVLGWFSTGRDPAAEGVREDDYLLFPDCDTVGVKLRQGKLEIKALLSAPRPLTLRVGQNLNGRMDQWIKWSFEDQGLKALDPALRQSGRWLRVRKERRLRKFSATGSLAEVPVDQTPLPSSGCNVELVRLEIPAHPPVWFSLGFEAFGSAAGNVETLDETLHHFFTLYGPPPDRPLTGRESLSYPAWLATFA